MQMRAGSLVINQKKDQTWLKSLTQKNSFNAIQC